MILLYRFITNILLIFFPFIIFYRLLKKKEDSKRFLEKISLYKKKRSNGKVVWFHGASVGEFQSIVPLLEKLDKLKDIDQILITSNTISSSKIILKTKLKKLTHQFFPIDHNYFVKKFVNYWRPSLAVFIDSEIWPNMFLNLDKKNIPIILINARITKKSYERWLIFKDLSKLIFGKIKLCLTANKESFFYLKKLGAKKIKYYGNLKYSQSENENIQINPNIMKFINSKKSWCASSTHNSEEKFIGLVHKKLKKKYKNLLTVIIPRHVDRENRISKELSDMGLKVHLHNQKNNIDKNIDIYLVNAFGQTKSFFSIIKNVFLGGSLINHGGQNPLEAVRFNCNILYGPNVQNFSEIYKFLHKQKIAFKINDTSQMIYTLKRLFNRNKKQKNIANKINKIGQKILTKNFNELKIIIDKT